MASSREFFFECPVDVLARAAIAAAAKKAIAEGGRLVIEGLNVAKLIHARRDAALMQALGNADIVHIDGAGIALGARVLGRRFPARRAGIDLMGDLLALCREQGGRVFLLGAKPQIVAAAAAAMRAQYPGLMIAGYRDGYFGEHEAADIAQYIAASGAALLLVGMSSPKKEIFLQRHMAACGVSVAMGVGGAFDVMAGAVARAPRWMRRAGLEWLYRLLQEPRRLGWRYLTTNSIFAGLLIRELLRKYGIDCWRQPVLSWPAFLDLLQHIHGEAALVCRHEIYFLRRKKYGMRVRAVAALLRDIGTVYTVPSATASPVAPTCAVATLAGPSGYGTLRRAIDALPDPAQCTLITHPRLGLGGMQPARPRAWDGIDACRRALPRLVIRRSAISRIVVFSCVMRRYLWEASWRRFHAAHPAMVRCLLHNDVDMMNSALVSALSPAVEMICIQHGVPTDEFFPTRAPVQIVWGESSRAVYARQHRGMLKMDGLGRGNGAPAYTAAPHALSLVSQTHTPLYGIDLAARFEALVQALVPHAAALNLRILLHPEEVKNATAYAAIDARYKARPPHPSLQGEGPVCMMVGYASTALIDAALAGHYVAAMDWPARASQGARAVSRPPASCTDGADVLALWHRLRESEAVRASHRAAQQQWLAATFAESGEFTAYFR